MESLYRKYRPQIFADVVGQQHVVGTLERAVLEGRTSHAYLFCGPRGTGKTTMARLLAKALMCEQGAGRLPDGTCEQCRLIAAGEHPDVYELDAASRTGVDNVREEIINRVGYAPVQANYKVYIIDEVHMLTTQAFNALLKTLEEPPEHVVFVLCTTDPQKIPATILSRVQRFDFRPIGNDDIQARLAYVCEQEGFTYDDAALELVVGNARGGMRDALSTLEQLSVFGGGVIGREAAQDLLGAVPGAALEQVVGSMAARDVAALFTQVGALVDSGRDLLQFTRELAARLRDVYVVQVVGPHAAILPAGSDVARLKSEAEAFGSADRLARTLALLGDVSREMSTAPNQRLVLEIAFTRIARPESDLTLDALAERVAELEGRLAAVLGAGGAAIDPAAMLASAGGLPVADPTAARPAVGATRGKTTTEDAGASVSSGGAEAASSVVEQAASVTAQGPMASSHVARTRQESEERGVRRGSKRAEEERTESARPVSRPTPKAGQTETQSPAAPAHDTEPRVSRERSWLPTAPGRQSQPRDVRRDESMRPGQAEGHASGNHAGPDNVPSASDGRSAGDAHDAATRRAQPHDVSDTREAASSAIADPGALQRMWRQVVSEMLKKYPPRGTLLTSATAVADNGRELTISLPKGSVFALKMLERADVRSLVEGVVASVFGPRTLVFREPLGSDLRPVAQPERNQASVPAQTPPAVSPAGPSASSAYATSPQQVSQPVPDLAPPAYPMPWDDPAAVAGSERRVAPTSATEDGSYYEAVPYEDLDAAYAPAEGFYDAGPLREERSSSWEAPQPSARDEQASRSATQSQKKNQSERRPTPPQESSQDVHERGASGRSPQGEGRAQPSVAQTPVTAPAVSSDSGAQSAQAPAQPPKQVPHDLPPELATILENAFEVFGNDVKVSR